MDGEWNLPQLDIEKTSYTVQEFIEWADANRLVLSPSFQRGQVWRRPAQAFLIDTILRGYPIPPVHVRFVQREGKGLVREVIDGQQRLTAVLEYVGDAFPMPKPRNSSEPLPPWAGLRFSKLPEELAQRILNFSFRCEAYKGQIPDETIYEIFSRINIHSVPLSDQELRNGRYFGEFKQAVYSLAREHKTFWRSVNLFTEQGIARMLDAQFVSEVLALQLGGMQDKKGSLDAYYAEFDASWPGRHEHEDRFRATIDAIRESTGEIISGTRFVRVPLFYTLYAVTYHRVFGIQQGRLPSGESILPVSPKSALSGEASERLRNAVQNISDHLQDRTGEEESEELGSTASTEQGEYDFGALGEFSAGAAGQTDNIRPRLARFRALWSLADLSRE